MIVLVNLKFTRTEDVKCTCWNDMSCSCTLCGIQSTDGVYTMKLEVMN